MLLTKIFPWLPWLDNIGRKRALPEYLGDMEKEYNDHDWNVHEISEDGYLYFNVFGTT